MKAIAGTHFSTVAITVNDPSTGTPHITYRLSDALITLYESDASVSSMIDTLSFSYSKLCTDVTEVGTTTTCYDFERNVAN